MRLLKSLNEHKGFWRRVNKGQLRPEVLPSAPAMLTAYLDELVKAMREAGEGRGAGGGPIVFSSLGRKQVVADFEGGDITGDAGAPLLREVDRHLGLIEQLSRPFGG